MQRDIDLYRRTEFGWFLGALGVGTAVASALPTSWWAKLVLGIVFGFLLLPLLGWLSGPLGRVLRFLLDPVIALPSGAPARSGSGGAAGTGAALNATALAANYGVDPNDPLASRVLLRTEPKGALMPNSVWPAEHDIVAEMHETRRRLDADQVYELVAMRGYERVGRWRASWPVRVQRAWARSADVQ